MRSVVVEEGTVADGDGHVSYAARRRTLACRLAALGPSTANTKASRPTAPDQPAVTDSRQPGLDQGEGFEGQDAEIASHLVEVTFDGVGLSGLEPLTSALSGEVFGVARPPLIRRGRPGRSGLIHGSVGPLSSRTTSRQPVVTIESHRIGPPA